MTQRKSPKLLSLILALLMAFMLLWTALPAQAEENVDALGPVTSKDVIYQIITDRFMTETRVTMCPTDLMQRFMMVPEMT